MTMTTTYLQLFANFPTKHICINVTSSGSAATAGKGHTKSASISSPRPSTDGCISVSIDPLGSRYTLASYISKKNKHLKLILIELYTNNL